MNTSFYIIIAIILFSLYFIFLKYIENKINILEKKIKGLFLERTSLIPAVFEVSNNYLNKHNDIFHEILNLRKIEFSQANNNVDLTDLMNTKKLIHHEINFIFKVCNKHPELIKEGSFIYIRNFLIKKSTQIGEEVEKYKRATDIFNKLIFYKNITLIGILFPVFKKQKI